MKMSECRLRWNQTARAENMLGHQFLTFVGALWLDPAHFVDVRIEVGHVGTARFLPGWAVPVDMAGSLHWLAAPTSGVGCAAMLQAITESDAARKDSLEDLISSARLSRSGTLIRVVWWGGEVWQGWSPGYGRWRPSACTVRVWVGSQSSLVEGGEGCNAVNWRIKLPHVATSGWQLVVGLAY